MKNFFDRSEPQKGDLRTVGVASVAFADSSGMIDIS
jgi:hypothetical protein